MWPFNARSIRVVNPTYVMPPLVDIIDTTMRVRGSRGFQYAPGARDRIIASVLPGWSWMTESQRIDAIEHGIVREELYFHTKTEPGWVGTYLESLNVLAA